MWYITAIDGDSRHSFLQCGVHVAHHMSAHDYHDTHDSRSTEQWFR